ncbi:hypothetical protein GCM10022243_49820 [Saccharothrix violaceirubra]|uniref:Uncharacterized protein n=1 Tax=Saccharothrix violaceirubra TaxID=413306 RepID=A0A7W7SZD0_9PSEU|nr:hypothetical protein [Saccharothrix violaceirubra]MBB4963674.1 hypothetical protein [Saccharothrix violaceirubra]
MTVDAEWQNSWTAAVYLYRHLAAGGVPEPVACPLVLGQDEVAYADLAIGYARYYSMTVEYQQSSGFFFGSPLFVAAGLAANAIGNANARNRAAAQSAPQWREHCVARTVVTNQRTMCQIQGQWLSFWHGGVVEFTGDPAAGWCAMTFGDSEPLMLTGPTAPWLTVLLSYFVHGAQRFPQLPHLHRLALS